MKTDGLSVLDPNVSVCAYTVIEAQHSLCTRKAQSAEVRRGKCPCRGHLTRGSAARTLLLVPRPWRECLQERPGGQAGAARIAILLCTGRKGNSLAGSSSCRSTDAHRTMSHGKRSRSRCPSQSGSPCAGSFKLSPSRDLVDLHHLTSPWLRRLLETMGDLYLQDLPDRPSCLTSPPRPVCSLVGSLGGRKAGTPPG